MYEHSRLPRFGVFVILLVTTCFMCRSTRVFAADEACKQAMSERIKVCAEDCRSQAMATAKIEDPNNNVLFLCIKKCAQDMAMQGQVCR